LIAMLAVLAELFDSRRDARPRPRDPDDDWSIAHAFRWIG